MVDALKNNTDKLNKAFTELGNASNPIERERIQIKIDNLLDIRLEIKRHDKEVRALANGN